MIDGLPAQGRRLHYKTPCTLEKTGARRIALGKALKRLRSAGEITRPPAAEALGVGFGDDGRGWIAITRLGQRRIDRQGPRQAGCADDIDLAPSDGVAGDADG